MLFAGFCFFRRHLKTTSFLTLSSIKLESLNLGRHRRECLKIAVSATSTGFSCPFAHFNKQRISVGPADTIQCMLPLALYRQLGTPS